MAEPRTSTGSVPTQGQQFTNTDTGSILDPVSRTEAGQMQFPSLAGQPNVEVAERSADVAKQASKVHRKVYRVFVGNVDFDEQAFNHMPNFTATRQFMVDHGLRPVGDVTFAGVEKYDENNVDLAYQVEAMPAAVATADEHPDQAHVSVPQD